MNIGQPVPGMTALRYEIRLSVPEWLDRFAAKHDQLMRELIDDEPYDDGTDEVVNALRELHWPRLEELVGEHFDVFRRYALSFHVEVLNALDASETRTPEFQLNTLDSVTRTADGVAFSHRPGRATFGGGVQVSHDRQYSDGAFGGGRTHGSRRSD